METEVNSFIYSTKKKDLTTKNDVKINLNSQFNRKQLPESLQNEIEDTWQNIKRSVPSLYNGTKFRLDSIVEHNETLTLNIGITCYKDFQGTNRSDNCLALQSQGLCDHDNCQAYLSDALGVGALIQTSDDHGVLMFRSSCVGEDAELWDRPGGHPEPKELVGMKTMEEIDISSLNADAVLEELFASPCSEITAEINIPSKHLEEAKLLGLHRSIPNGAKPNAEFLVKCNLSAKEVEALYEEGTQEEAFESQKILVLPMEQLVNARMNNKELWDKMAPGAKGLLTLYNMYKHRYLA